MQEIANLCARLIPVIETTLDCYGKNKQLYPLQEAIHDMQMGFYWLQEALTHMSTVGEGEIETEGERARAKALAMHAPSIISSRDQIEYITAQLATMRQELETFSSGHFFPPEVQRRIDRGHDNLTEGFFNLKLSKTYYEEIQGSRRGGNRGQIVS